MNRVFLREQIPIIFQHHIPIEVPLSRDQIHPFLMDEINSYVFKHHKLPKQQILAVLGITPWLWSNKPWALARIKCYHSYYDCGRSGGRREKAVSGLGRVKPTNKFYLVRNKHLKFGGGWEKNYSWPYSERIITLQKEKGNQRSPGDGLSKVPLLVLCLLGNSHDQRQMQGKQM